MFGLGKCFEVGGFGFFVGVNYFLFGCWVGFDVNGGDEILVIK